MLTVSINLASVAATILYIFAALRPSWLEVLNNHTRQPILEASIIWVPISTVSRPFGIYPTYPHSPRKKACFQHFPSPKSHPTMIRIDSVSKQNGHQILFVEASTALNQGEKIGLAAPNGAGFED